MLKIFIKFSILILVILINFFYINHLKVQRNDLIKQTIQLKQENGGMAAGVMELLDETELLITKNKQLQKQIDIDHNI